MCVLCPGIVEWFLIGCLAFVKNLYGDSRKISMEILEMKSYKCLKV